MRGMVRDSLLEMLDRRLFVIFLIVTALWVLGVMVTGGGDVQVHSEGMGPVGSGGVWGWLETFDLFLSLLLLLIVIGTAGIIPKMLVAGRVEYYLSKPISRSWLLLNKMFGLWAVYGTVLIVCGSIYLAALAATHGLHSAGVLYVFAEKLLALFVWLSISVCVGILTRSFSMAVVAVFGVWLAQLSLYFYQVNKELGITKFLGIRFAEDGISKFALDSLYYALPKLSHQARVGLNLAAGKPVDNWLPVWSTALFGFALVAVAIWLFRRKDY